MVRAPGHCTLIGRFREATRLAAFVLASFLASTALTVACAAHDLADAGIVGGIGAADTAPDAGDVPGNDAPATHAGDDCSHGGCFHAPALLPLVAPVAMIGPGSVFHVTDTPRPVSTHRRELRPPIL